MGNGPHIQTIWPDYWKTKQKNGKRKEALTVPDSCNNESNQSSTTTTTTLWSVTLSLFPIPFIFSPCNFQISHFNVLIPWDFVIWNEIIFVQLGYNNYTLIFLLSQSRTLTWIPNPDLNRSNVVFSTLFATIQWIRYSSPDSRVVPTLTRSRCSFRFPSYSPCIRR
jgi:hypothetical protein